MTKLICALYKRDWSQNQILMTLKKMNLPIALGTVLQLKYDKKEDNIADLTSEQVEELESLKCD